MNSDAIAAILRGERATHDVFRGVYAQNEIRQAMTKCERLEAPSAFVINSDPITLPGEHWLAVFHNRSRQFEFFDTYDMSPSTYGLDGSWNFINTNTRKVQALDSNACGQHCIFYIHERCIHPSEKDPYTQFPQSMPVEQIDAFVKQYVMKLRRDDAQAGNGNVHIGAFRQIANTYAHFRKLLDPRVYKPV
jgi:hypothetical protein